MKESKKMTWLPSAAVVLGAAAMLLRGAMYLFGVDGKGLLIENHPLKIGMMVLTAATVLLLLVMSRKLDGSEKYEDNFAPSRKALLGHLAAAAGIAFTVLTGDPLMPGYLGQCWLVLGYLAPVCLVLAGICRERGKRPFFALHLVASLFFVFQVVNHYRSWSGDPQFQNYGYALFGTMALSLFGFYSSCFDAEAGRRSRQLFMGLAAVYLLMAELVTTEYPVLYVGGILWILSDLCTLTPKPKPEPEPEEQKQPQEGA